MVRNRSLAACLAACLLAGCIAAAGPAADAAEGFAIDSITWQDPENAVLIWPHAQGYTYEVYRAEAEGGPYEQIGTASSGSYRDGTVEFPKEYYYQVRPIAPDGTAGEPSQPVKTGTDPQPLSEVTVIMYHNFITEEDIANGVVFDEYSATPEEFEADLQYLKSNGYTTITSDDLIQYMHGEKPLPPKAVIISIDDGTWGVYQNAWPLLKKYQMKADFNVIGQQIDRAWETTHGGGTRVGEEAPYCDWNEIIEMVESGEINLCSHTYGLHYYDPDGRIGMKMLPEESIEAYTAVIQEDFRLTTSCITGWTHIVPRTVAYPYSRRSEVTDQVLLANTTYEVLMAGDGARATKSNYFVDGASQEGYLPLINRPCRMSGSPIQDYLVWAQDNDYANGVNAAPDTLGLTAARCDELAALYSPFTDVGADAWYRGSVYYAYVNGILTGVGPAEFAPEASVSRGMAAALLCRMAGQPDTGGALPQDVQEGQWYTGPVRWAVGSGVMALAEDGLFSSDAAISREELAEALYRYAGLQGLDQSGSADLGAFEDGDSVSPAAARAMEWAVAQKIFTGSETGMLDPQGSVTRAQMATILQRWLQSQA